MKKTRNFAILFHDAVEKGLLLFTAAILAMVVANSNYSSCYEYIFNINLGFSLGNSALNMPISSWVNELLMVFFFLVIGIEIKKESTSGHLATASQRILPIISAFFGVLIPSLIYYILNKHDDAKAMGWAIPAATDIAFTLGVVNLFGKSIPHSLKIFLISLAIIDDLIAVVIIALFYNTNLQHEYSYLIFFAIAMLYLLNYMKINYIPVYIVAGILMWYGFLKFGIHPTLAGVVLGLLLPLETISNLAHKIEKSVQPIVLYIILPLFAFVNSGLSFKDISYSHFTDTVTLGVVLGLVLGKQIGIFGTVFGLIKSKLVPMPSGANFKTMYAVSVLCGIGFTMSLFVTILSFDSESEYFSEAKLGVMLGSVLSMCIGVGLIKAFSAISKN